MAVEKFEAHLGKKFTPLVRSRLFARLGYDAEGNPTGLGMLTLDEVAAVEGARNGGKPVKRQSIQESLKNYGLTDGMVEALAARLEEGPGTDTDASTGPTETVVDTELQDAEDSGDSTLSAQAGAEVATPSTGDGTDWNDLSGEEVMGDTRDPEAATIRVRKDLGSGIVNTGAEDNAAHAKTVVASALELAKDPNAPQAIEADVAELARVAERVMRSKVMPDGVAASVSKIGARISAALEKAGDPRAELFATAQQQSVARRKRALTDIMADQDRAEREAAQMTANEKRMLENARETMRHPEAATAQADWDSSIAWGDLTLQMQADWVMEYLDNLERNNDRLDFQELVREQGRIEDEFRQYQKDASARESAGRTEVAQGEQQEARVPESQGRAEQEGDGAAQEVVVGAPDASVTVKVKKKRTVPKTGPAFSRAPDTGQGMAESEVQAHVDALKASWALAPEIVVVASMQDARIPQRVRDHDAKLKSQGADGDARGFIYGGEVYLVADQLTTAQDVSEVALHEVLGHFGLRGAFGAGLSTVLRQVAATRQAAVLAKAREYGMVGKSLSDAAAWKALSEKDRLMAAEEVLAELAQTRPELGLVKRAIAAVRSWLRENVPGFANLKMSDAELVQKFIVPARGFVERGRTERAEPTGDVSFSRTQPRPAVQAALARMPRQVRAPVEGSMNALADWTSKAVDRMVFTNDLVSRAAEAGMGSAKRFEALIAARDTKAREMERDAERVADLYVHVPQADRGTGERSVNRFLFDSTREGKWGFGRYRDAVMGPRFDALSPQSQAFVRGVLKHGDEMLAKKKSAVLAFTVSEYDARIAAHRDAGETAEMNKALKAKEADLAKFKALFALREGLPYAPIKRMGSHAVVAKSVAYRQAEARGDEVTVRKLEKDPDHYHVSFADGKGAARRLAAELREQGFFGTDENAVDFFEREKFQNELFGGDSMLAALTKLRAQVDARAANGDQGASRMRDMVGEMYLEALAEGSARKSEMRRRGVSGEVDMLRSFAAQGGADANFLASIESNPKVQDAMQAMRTEARQGGNRARKSELLNELSARYVQSLSIEPTPTLNKLTRMSSIWFLATSPAYYLQNLMQPWMMSLPSMAGRHGYGKSSGALFEAYTELGPVMESAKLFSQQFDFDKVPDDVRGAIKDLADQGRIDIGLETEMGEFQVEGAGALKDGWNKVDKGMRLLVQKGESINRLSTAIAAYRLEVGKGATHEKAVEYAGQVLDNTHGNYGRFNAPRAFNTKLGKVALQFRKFQLIQASFFVKMVRDAYEGRERAVALKTLGYALGHTALMAGAIGLPGYAALSFVLGAAMGSDDEKFDLTDELRKFIGDEDLANLILRGAPTLAGADMSGKVGAGTMLSVMPFSTADLRTSQGQAEAVGTMLGGASLGMTSRILDGAQLMMGGDWYKGLERVLPKGFGDALKAARIGQDGLTRRNGDVILPPEEVSAVETVMQGLGIMPSKQAEVYERRSRAYEAGKNFTERSTRIKNDYIRAMRRGDVEGQKEARAAWTKLQDAKFANGVARQPLSALLKAPQEQRKREASTVRGVGYNRSNQAYVQSLTER